MAGKLPERTFKPTAEFLWTFGGGLNSRASPRDIDMKEDAGGQNFTLDLDNHEFHNRPGFDLVGQVPNGQPILGFAQLWRRDGTISTLVQAGTTVYYWDGANFTSVGTVAAGAKLRGDPYRSLWLLDERVLIADMALQQPVMSWDGETFGAVSFKKSDGTSFGSLAAKYILTEGERAWYTNVVAGSATPQMLVGSAIDDYETVSDSNKPTSAIGTGDPFYMLSPDLRPINGFLRSWLGNILSTRDGNTYQLSGTDATNFAFTNLFPQSGVDGDEACCYIGNDIALGRQGRIPTLFGTLNFGNVETFDLSRKIADQVQEFSNWLIIYNKRYQRIYAFPQAVSIGSGKSLGLCFVMFKPIFDDTRMTRFFASNDFGRIFAPGNAGVSPWAIWRTQHPMSFMPTAAMTLYDPIDGLEHSFMGDGAGNIYRLEGDGAMDGGSAPIIAQRVSKVFEVPNDAELYDVDAYIEYRKGSAARVTIDVLWQGQKAYTHTNQIPIPAPIGGAYFGGPYYFGGSPGNAYFGLPGLGQLLRQKFDVAGKSNQLQCRATIEGSTPCQITQIELRFKAAS